VGCIIAEMVRFIPLFPGESEEDQFYLVTAWLDFQDLRTTNEILEVAGLPCQDAIQEQWRQDWFGLVRDCLTDSSTRIVATDAEKHPWFTRTARNKKCVVPGNNL
jgi:hypothetical protein